MARPLRVEFEGALYHVTSRGNERKQIFFTGRDYQRFKEYVGDAQQKYGFLLHAYVLMSNHYHMLLETPQKNLSAIMHYINSSYTMYTNTKRNRAGHLFQGRFKSIIVDKDNYLVELSRYIHLNPVRAKIVENPGSYLHSSYPAYVSDISDPLVTRSTILRAFGTEVSKAQMAYQAFVEAALVEELESPLDHVYGGGILGDEEFIHDVLEQLDVERIDNEHIAHRKELRVSNHPDDIMAHLADITGVQVEEAIKKGSPLRKIVVYLLKKYSCATNRQISDILGVRDSSTSAKIYENFVKQLESDDALKRQLTEIEAAFSRFKARPHG